MPFNTEEVMHVLSQVADQRNLRVAVTESLKCGLLVGAAATVFGILMGPFGIAFGGTAGSLVAAWKSQGKFKSVASVIIEDMTPHQQTQLAASCMQVIRDLRVEDLVILLPLVLNTPSVQQALVNQLISFVTKEMQLKIID